MKAEFYKEKAITKILKHRGKEDTPDNRDMLEVDFSQEINWLALKLATADIERAWMESYQVTIQHYGPKEDIGKATVYEWFKAWEGWI